MGIIVFLVCIAGAAAAYLLFTAGKRPAPDERWVDKWLYAHRGLHNEDRPENSMAAFKAAVQAGYGIELDVRLTADNIVVVFHDSDLKRMTGTEGTVESQTLRELRRLRLGGTEETVPTLEEVLRTVDGRVPLLIETKNLGLGDALEQHTMKLLRPYKGKYALQSFSPFAVRRFRKCAPWDPRGQLSSTFRPRERGVSRIMQFCVRHLLTNFIGRPNFISYAWDGLNSWVVRRLRRRGLPVLAWTVRSASEAAQAMPLCDTIIFEGFLPGKPLVGEN